ncbi:MAG TPA: hypothetical protein VHN19_11600 [Burkholderiales bacterium]|nr:hypothetical protein [Burkholderiales bacterium]HEX2650570.1 hypothetical protein [Burkholderiales bacterium]
MLLTAFVPALADDAARSKKMVELVSSVNLPYIQRTLSILFEEMQRDLPRKFVEKIGVDNKLGANWKQGNRFFDRAEARLQAKFAESQQGGRLSPPTPTEIARIIRTSWTEDDLDFLVRYVKTDTGKQVLEFIDALNLPTLRTALTTAHAPGQFESRTADIALEATQRLGALTATLAKLPESTKGETDRAIRLVKGIDGKSGESVSQFWLGKLVNELIAIARQEKFEIRMIAEEFRRAEGPLSAPPAAAPAPSRL